MEELLIQGAEQLPTATETKLRSIGDHKGGKWSDTVTGFPIGIEETILKFKVNLSGCTSANENIISIGDNIAVGINILVDIHAYYTK